MDFLLEYKDYIFLLGLNFLISVVYIYIPTQAIVYIFGRMLDITRTDRSRNLVALISTGLFSLGYVYMKKEFPTIPEYVWEFFHWFSMGVLLYVLIGFRLFSRVDTFLDKKVSKDRKSTRS